MPLCGTMFTTGPEWNYEDVDNTPEVTLNCKTTTPSKLWIGYPMYPRMWINQIKINFCVGDYPIAPTVNNPAVHDMIKILFGYNDAGTGLNSAQGGTYLERSAMKNNCFYDE